MKRAERASHSDSSRRNFLKQSSMGLAGAAAAAGSRWCTRPGAGSRSTEIKIGLIGCGGRGTGAALDALGAATKVIYPSEGYHTEDVAEGAKVEHANIKVVALADLFDDRLEQARGELAKLGIDIARNRCFTGFDAYEKLLEIPEINYVILATPPHFRPTHLKAAIEAGKNVVHREAGGRRRARRRMVIEAGELARKKNLGIAAGTQRRHQKSYLETIKRIKDGAIGDILYAKAYWNGGQIWVVDREPSWSDIEWQLRNWNYFTWLGGDHIVEQHVHNLDVMNWVLGTHPVRAVSGLGGRQARKAIGTATSTTTSRSSTSTPAAITVFSQCRQIDGCQNIVGESVVGTKGTSNCTDRIEPKGGWAGGATAARRPAPTSRSTRT